MYVITELWGKNNIFIQYSPLQQFLAWHSSLIQSNKYIGLVVLSHAEKAREKCQKYWNSLGKKWEFWLCY